MPFRLRAYTAEDQTYVDALLDADADPLFADQLHTLHGPDRDGDRWRRTLLAVSAEGAVLGAGTVARNRVHPKRLSAVVEVAAAHRRQGIGSALLTAARSLRPLPLAGKVFEDDVRGLSFARGHGGVSYARCPGLSFSAPYDELTRWARAQPIPSACRVGSIARSGQLLDAWSQLYVSIHADWSPTAEDAVLGDVFGDIVDDIDGDLSTGVWLGDRLVAVSFVLAESPTSATIVAETMTRDQVGGGELLGAALVRCFQQVAGPRFTEILLDGHDADPNLAPITAELPASTRRPLLLIELP